MLSPEYVTFLESLPCTRHARRRSRHVGAWLAGWVPEQQVEPRQTGTSEMEALRERLQGEVDWGSGLYLLSATY